jgi:hypothetical protein
MLPLKMKRAMEAIKKKKMKKNEKKMKVYKTLYSACSILICFAILKGKTM